MTAVCIVAAAFAALSAFASGFYFGARVEQMSWNRLLDKYREEDES